MRLLTMAALAVCAVPANAQEPPQAVLACGPLAQVEAVLTEAGQQKVATGTAAGAAVALYVNMQTGRWVMTVTEDGIACLTGSGGDFTFEDVPEEPARPPVAPIVPAKPRGLLPETVV